MTDRFKEAIRLREQKSFLGFEFLSWLFLFLERPDAKEQIKSLAKNHGFKTDIAVVLGNRLVTCLLNHREQKTSVVSPILEESHEAFASIRNGHVIEALSINILLGDISVSLMIHSLDFSFTQIKIKNHFDNSLLDENDQRLNEEDQIREEVFLRMAVVEDIERLIGILYKHFLGLRTNGAVFLSAQKDMNEQVEKRLSHYLHRNHGLSLPVLPIGEG